MDKNELITIVKNKLLNQINIESISAIPVCYKTAPKTNKNVFLSAIQKYLSS